MIDDVREEHGVVLVKGYCRVQEQFRMVRVTTWGGDPIVKPQYVDMQPSEARYLAAKLRRLARRAEERQQGAA